MLALLTPDDYTRFPFVPPYRRYHYGVRPQQFGELYLPTTSPPHSVIVLVHGGCYREMYDLKPISSVAQALADDGFAVWNIEYRRAGNGGDYPNMFLDVAKATDFLRQIAEEHGLNLSCTLAVGHSAGGHLALWLAGRPKLPASSALHLDDALPVSAVLALAPVADIAFAFTQDLCSDALPLVMGGKTTEAADLRYASPSELLPLGLPQTHIVGSEDVAILANVERYLAAAKAHGDVAELIVIPQTGHFEIVAVESPAWQPVHKAIRQLRDFCPDS